MVVEALSWSISRSSCVRVVLLVLVVPLVRLLLSPAVSRRRPVWLGTVPVVVLAAVGLVWLRSVEAGWVGTGCPRLGGLEPDVQRLRVWLEVANRLVELLLGVNLNESEEVRTEVSFYSSGRWSTLGSRAVCSVYSCESILARAAAAKWVSIPW